MQRLAATPLALLCACSFALGEPLDKHWSPPAQPACNVGGGLLVLDGSIAFISFVAPMGGDAKAAPEEQSSPAALVAVGLLLASPWLVSLGWGIVKRRECNRARQMVAQR